MSAFAPFESTCICRSFRLESRQQTVHFPCAELVLVSFRSWSWSACTVGHPPAGHGERLNQFLLFRMDAFCMVACQRPSFEFHFTLTSSIFIVFTFKMPYLALMPRYEIYFSLPRRSKHETRTLRNACAGARTSKFSSETQKGERCSQQASSFVVATTKNSLCKRKNFYLHLCLSE